MAEIRKFDPASGNAIAQALKAAMGEPVRPADPGGVPAARDRKPAPQTTTSWVAIHVTSGTAERDDASA